MGDMYMYHQTLATLRRKDKSESNDAKIKLIQVFVDSLAIEMEEN